MRKTTKPRLTDKEKSALDEYIADKKISRTEAIRRSNYNANDKSAKALAHRLFNKPAAQRYLEEHAETAANNIVEMANDKSIKPETRLKANQDILDRTDGKATQKSINTSQTVKIIADFTGGAAGPSPGGQAGERPKIEASVSEPETHEVDVLPPSADD